MAVQIEARSVGVVPAGAALTAITQWLDRVDPDRSALAPADRLAWAKVARVVADRASALAQVLVGEAERAQASERTSGTPMSSWLSVAGGLSKRESAGLLHRARALTDNPQVAEAAAAGRIGAGQAKAITDVLGSLAPQLDERQRERAQGVMVGLASQLDADHLAKAAGRVLAAVAPQNAEDLLEERLQREAEAAQRRRSLVFFNEGSGSVGFKGSLPRVEAEQWRVQIDAWVESLRRSAIERRDPVAGPLTPEQRRADALIAIIRAGENGERTPTTGGERPRLMVRIDYDALRRQAAGAGLIADDQPLSAGELRQLCCDAELVPAVMGGAGQVLDIGRESRTIPRAIRAALVLRDGGCSFPGCHTRPNVCEAHHLTPWYLGGPTSLGNLALLCHHHHGLLEPARFGIRDQWQIRIAADGLPEVIPPTRVDPARRPLRHQRHAAAGPPGSAPAAGQPPDETDTAQAGAA